MSCEKGGGGGGDEEGAASRHCCHAGLPMSSTKSLTSLYLLKLKIKRSTFKALFGKIDSVIKL